MMGTKVRSFHPHIHISLEDLVPRDSFYRHVEATLDLSFVRDLVKDKYSVFGRPSIDPVVFFKLQLVMFFERLRSERQLVLVAADRLSVRWYLGYDLHEVLPEHSSMTRIRDRYGVAIFRRFFDRIVDQCQRAGLVWGKELYIDATIVDANADRDAMVPRFYADAVNAHLAELFPADSSPPQQQRTGEQADGQPQLLRIDLPPEIETELAAVNAQRHDWIAAIGRPNRAETRGTYQRVADLWVSTTDPDATLMRKRNGAVHLSYQTHYVVDGGKARIILAALVTPSEVMENLPMLDLVWRTRFRWGLPLEQVTGDTTYGTIDNIVALEKAGIRAYVSLPDFEKRTPFFGRSAFNYDATYDQYTCPNGALLPRRKAKYTERVIIYQADAATCNVCPLKAKCTESEQGRQVGRNFDEAYLDRVRSYHTTEAYKKAMRKRKVWVEPLFGEGKEWHGLARFRLRMLEKVNMEGLLIAIGQNLKRLLSWRGWGRRWWPSGAIGVAIPNEKSVDCLGLAQHTREQPWRTERRYREPSWNSPPAAPGVSLAQSHP
jgi:transposase